MTFRYVDVSAVSNELWRIESSTEQTGSTAPSRARKRVRADDVIFATVRPTLRRVAMVPNHLDGHIVSTAFCVLRTDPAKIDPRFVYYSVLTDEFIDRIANSQRGASYPAVTDSDIFREEIAVPPLSEQRGIAATLAKIQGAVEVQAKIVATLKELKAATMAKLFREGVVRGFMFDSHIFDKILDDGIDPFQLRSCGRVFVTHIQRDEIERCREPERRRQLLQVFELVAQEVIPTESAVWNVSRWGQAKWSDDNPTFEEVRRGNLRHTEDTLITETCIKQNLVLVTHDKDLQKRVHKAKGETIRLEDLLAGRPRRVKQTEIGEVPEGWKVVRLGSIARIGNGSTPKRDDPRYWEDGTIPWLTSAKVHESVIEFADEFVTEAARVECHLPLVRKGSVVVAITGQGKTLGNVALVKFDTCVSQHLAYIQFEREEVLPEFMLFFLQNRYDHFRQISQSGGSTRGALTCRFLNSYPVPLPPILEQRRIGNTLGSILMKLRAEEGRRQTLKNLFSSMLHLLMTGQVRVGTQEARSKQWEPLTEKVERFVAQLVRRFEPERVVLFGSHAEGTATADSDVDLLVVMPFEGRGSDQAARIDCALKRDFALDLLVRRPEAVRQGLEQGDPFMKEIVEKGKVLYARPE